MNKNNPSLQGIVDILLENQLDFDFVNNGDFSRFDTVIIPSGVVADDSTIAKLNDFSKDGGKLLLIGDALVKDGKHQINTGVKSIEKCENDTDFIMTHVKGATGLPKSPFLSYIPAPICLLDGAELHAELYPPLFNRTYGSFCGHRNTPYDKECEKFPALTKYKNTVFMAHDIGALYNTYGMLCYRDYLVAALRQVLGYEPVLKVSLGSSGRVTLLHQMDRKRYSVNLTYASPSRRGMAEIIDEIVPIYGIDIEISLPEKVSRVYAPLSDLEIGFTLKDGKISFTLPKLLCHESIVIEY